MRTNVQEPEILKTLGVRIRNLRSTRGLSQAQLADSIGMSVRYLGEVEAGKRNVSLGRLNALAQRLSISLAELLEFEEPQTKDAILKDVCAFLGGLSLSQLLFIQRILHIFVR